ncbi:MAG: hypothetical protein ACP5N6_14320, partial [Anaerolineae bacterium]
AAVSIAHFTPASSASGALVVQFLSSMNFTSGVGVASLVGVGWGIGVGIGAGVSVGIGIPKTRVGLGGISVGLMGLTIGVGVSEVGVINSFGTQPVIATRPAAAATRTAPLKTLVVSLSFDIPLLFLNYKLDFSKYSRLCQVLYSWSYFIIQNSICQDPDIFQRK